MPRQFRAVPVYTQQAKTRVLVLSAHHGPGRPSVAARELHVACQMVHEAHQYRDRNRVAAAHTCARFSRCGRARRQVSDVGRTVACTSVAARPRQETRVRATAGTRPQAKRQELHTPSPGN